jgi:hypothetical protein
MAMKEFETHINGIRHTFQASNLDEARKLAVDAKEIKAAATPANKSDTPPNK